MKILYIALKYDYGRRARGLSFEHYNFYETLCKMHGAQHQIVYFPIDEVMSEFGQETMNVQLLSVAKRERPDLCFFFLFTDEIYPKTVRAITDLGIKTYNWFADDHFRFDNFSKYWCWNFNFVSTTDSAAIAKYQNIGYKNILKTQWACNHFSYQKPNDLPLKYDISFVGQPYGSRKKIIQGIIGKGINVDCFGQGWPNGRITQQQMIETFYQSRINLNLAASSGFDWKNLARIFIDKNRKGYKINAPIEAFDNFNSFISRQRPQIKGRVFEVPGSGGLLFTNDADNLKEYYNFGKEIVVFSSEKDLFDKAKYYLAHEKERSDIAFAGYERTLREHTYEKRFEEIFSMMKI